MFSRSPTIVEAAAFFAIGASVLAVFIPEFVSNLRASRLAEPVYGLGRIAEGAVAGTSGDVGSKVFPFAAPLTPADVPRGTREDDPPASWDHPTWRALGLSFDHPHSFSFAFTPEGPPGSQTFRAVAHGDLDGDGVLSTFEIEGHTTAEGAEVAPGMFIDREVE